jgi:hypothetical protein
LKDFVSDRRRAAVATSAMLLVGAALLAPATSWMDYVSHSALAVLLMTTTVVCLGRLGPANASAMAALPRGGSR